MLKINNEWFSEDTIEGALCSLMDVRTGAIDGTIPEKEVGICGNLVVVGEGSEEERYKQFELISESFALLGLDECRPLGRLRKSNWKGNRLLRRLLLINKLEILWKECLGIPVGCWQVDFRYSRLIDPVEWKGSPHQRRLLNLGILHTTRESALFFANQFILRSQP